MRGKGMRGRAHFSGLSEQPQDEGLTGGVSHSARGKREAVCQGGKGRGSSHREQWLTCEHSRPADQPACPEDTAPSAGPPPGYAR